MNSVAFSTPGFMELLVLGVLALLIFGPDRLPGMARNAGRMISRFKREAADTLDELKQAADIEELRGVADELRSAGSELRSTGTDLQRAGADLKNTATLGTSRPAAVEGSGAEDGAPPFDPDAT